MTAQQERLRAVAVSLRTELTPLSDLIFLLNQTADHIDKLEAENERLRKDAERKSMTESQRLQMLDRLGAHCEGMDGEGWDRYVIRATEAFHNIEETP